jgi:hypothetical protein
VEASLFYHIDNPLLAFSRAFDSNDDIVKTLRDQTMATLTNVVRRQQFANVGKNDQTQQKSLTDTIDYEKFLESTTSTFAKIFQEKFGDPNGVVIESLVITSFNFENQAMQENITQNAMLYAKSKADLENVDAASRIAQAKAEKDRMVKLTEVTTELQVAEQRAQQVRITNQSEADKLTLLAKARAEALRIEADAEYYRQEKVALAAARMIELLGRTPFGQQYVLAKLQADALANTRMVMMERIPSLLQHGAFDSDATPAAAEPPHQ